MPPPLGLPDLTGLYQASNDPTRSIGGIRLDTTRGAFKVNGTDLGTGTAGNDDGPEYMRIERGAVNILSTSYNALDGTAHIHSSAIQGLDIGPDPAIIPNRSTITIRPDLLLFLKEDRSFGVGPGSGFFNWLSDVTITGGGSAGGFVSLDGRIIFDGVDASGFGMGNALRAGIDWVGVGGTNLGPGFVFAGNNTFVADGGATLAPQTRIYLDNSTYSTVAGGTLTTGPIGHNSLFSFLTVGAGCTIALRRGAFVQDATGAGVITTQIGVDIDPLNFATTNIGIRVQMSAADGDVWNTVGFTGAMRLGGEIELDGDLNHDGANIGWYGTAPVAQDVDIVALTDGTGGAANNALVAIAGSGADAAINDNFADLTAKFNALRDHLRRDGRMA